MRIAANAAIYPQHIVTNDDICRYVRSHTPSVRGRKAPKTIPQVERYLSRLGAKHRRWLAASERPIDLIRQAYEVALEQADVDPGTIDNLTYCGVDRALLEPANAALLASELGLPWARAFDVVHACQGWFTALQIAGDRADMHDETTLIVAAEFPMTDGGVARPKNFDLSDFANERWKLATFVLGEAATATIVTPGGSPLRFKQRNDNSGYRASYVRLPQAERFTSRSSPKFDAPEMTFYSSSSDLVGHGALLGFEVFDALRAGETDPIVVIPHTISSRLVRHLRIRYPEQFPIMDIFPEFGNIGTASMPAGLHRLERLEPSERMLMPGRPVGWMLAAGMAAVAFDFPSR